MLTAYDDFETAIQMLKRAPSIEAFCKNEEYKTFYHHVRKYLNVYELMAVGIETKMLDTHTCFRYASDVVIATYGDCKELIEYLQQSPADAHCYAAMVSRAMIWKATKEKMARKTELPLRLAP